MKIKMAGDSLSRGIALRSLIYGIVVGIVAFAGASVSLGLAREGPEAVSLVLATFLLSLGVGLWAGGAPPRDGRTSQRWVAAAGFIAAAGTFSTFLDLYEAMAPGRGWLIASLIIGIALPAYTLGMIGPELLAWARASVEADADEVVDPVGLILLASVIGLAAGILLVGSFALGAISSGSILIAAALLLLGGLALPQPERTGPTETTLFEEVSPFGHLLVTQVDHVGERQPERRLYLNGEEESGELVRSGAPTLAYIAAAEAWMSASTLPGSRYLFLGGGAYTLPRRIAERDPRASIVVVELDPEVTRIAQRFFGLAGASGITTVNGDARAFLEAGGAGQTFDRIYVDVYGGSEALPFSLVTSESVETMRRRLSETGIAAVNLIGRVVGEEQRPLWSTIRTFASVMPQVSVYVHLGRDYPDRQNLLLLGAQREGATFPKSAGGFELWPREEWPDVEGTIIYRDIGQTSTTASAPGRPPTPQRRQRHG